MIDPGPSDLEIRPMTRDDLAIAIDWAAGEGWNPGLRDVDGFYAADAGGFWMGWKGDAPVAAISAVRYGERFGFLGLYIVTPEERGKGYGLRVWNSGMAALAGRTVGLDGVVAQQANYRKSGFEFAHRNVRYEGKGGGGATDDPGIVLAESVPFDALCAFDRPFFPDRRTEFLRNWIRQPGCRALALREDGALSGYGVMRPCRSGWKIGPLFSESPEGAERLFLALIAGADEGIRCIWTCLK